MATTKRSIKAALSADLESLRTSLQIAVEQGDRVTALAIFDRLRAMVAESAGLQIRQYAEIQRIKKLLPKPVSATRRRFKFGRHWPEARP